MKRISQRYLSHRLVLSTLLLLGGVACNSTPSSDVNPSVDTAYERTRFPVLGLRGEYFSRNDWTGPKVVQTDAQINFNWGTGSALQGIRPGQFSARWKGQIVAQKSGTYWLSLNSRGG